MALIMYRYYTIEFFILISVAAPSRISRVYLTKTVRDQRPALRVNWTTPQSDIVISHYQVQYGLKTSRRMRFNVSLSANSVILTRLNAGTEYNVRVRAVSDVGDGMWSEEQSERTFNCE